MTDELKRLLTLAADEQRRVNVLAATIEDIVSTWHRRCRSTPDLGILGQSKDLLVQQLLSAWQMYDKGHQTFNESVIQTLLDAK